MGGRTFECLDAVINRYRKEQIVEGHCLSHPVRKKLCLFYDAIIKSYEIG